MTSGRTDYYGRPLPLPVGHGHCENFKAKLTGNEGKRD